MQQTAKRNLSAFTLIEVLVIIVIVAVAALMVLPRLDRARRYSGRNYLQCMNNLKEIGVAYRFWAADNGDLAPAQQRVSKGGWSDLLTNTDQGALCWTNYRIMQNELGQSPSVLLCNYDEREPAKDFKTDFKDNTQVSYFVGVGANDVYPQSIQGGDRNLGPGNTPDSDYGFSPKSGKGNDVMIPISVPVTWSLKIHSVGNPAGAGNILLGDGSGQRCSSMYVNKMWLRNAEDSSNFPAGHIPASPSIRLVFP